MIGSSSQNLDYMILYGVSKKRRNLMQVDNLVQYMYLHAICVKQKLSFKTKKPQIVIFSFF